MPLVEMAKKPATKRSVRVHLYQGLPGAALDNVKNWHRGNPGLRAGIKSLAFMRKEMARAAASAGDENSIRADQLNELVDPETENLSSVAEYRRCCVADQDRPPAGGVCWIGYDPGGSESPAGFAVIYLNGRAEFFIAVGGVPNLQMRSKADHVGTLYQEMEREGSLLVFPGCRVSPTFEFLDAMFGRLPAGAQPVAFASDKFRQADTLDALRRCVNIPAGMDVFWKGTGPGQGHFGNANILAWQRLVKSEKIKWADTVLLRESVRRSRVTYGPGGGMALLKDKAKSRIDALQAGVQAAGLAEKFIMAPAASAEDPGPRLTKVERA